MTRTITRRDANDANDENEDEWPLPENENDKRRQELDETPTTGTDTTPTGEGALPATRPLLGLLIGGEKTLDFVARTLVLFMYIFVRNKTTIYGTKRPVRTV
jgi:hypothetical protein